MTKITYEIYNIWPFRVASSDKIGHNARKNKLIFKYFMGTVKRH